MESKKVRFKLNLFDGIILALALCVALVLGYMMFRPAPAEQAETPSASTVQYTLRFQKMLEGTGSLIQPGDTLTDAIKNYNLGEVVATEILPAETSVVDEFNKETVTAVIEGYEDVLVTVKGTGSMGENSILLDGGYALRVNTVAYIKGNGYMGSGPVVSIEREVQG